MYNSSFPPPPPKKKKSSISPDFSTLFNVHVCVTYETILIGKCMDIQYIIYLLKYYYSCIYMEEYVRCGLWPFILAIKKFSTNTEYYYHAQNNIIPVSNGKLPNNMVYKGAYTKQFVNSVKCCRYDLHNS